MTKDFDKILEKFKVTLKANNLKYTKQREAIVSFIYNNKGHFTPEEINDALKTKHKDMKIGIATIYRTLTLLEESGMVTSLSFDTQGKKYEFGLTKHHDHIVCSECGLIKEFYDETIEKRQHEIAKKLNFTLEDHHMKLIGLCESCQKKRGKN
jgi:Fur family ferric uptake transcriptional regulator